VSDEKKTLMCDANLKDGDTAWVRVLVNKHDEVSLVNGDCVPVRKIGDWAGHLKVPVRDIVRAPVPREVVTMQYEVVPFSEMKAGDYHEAETGLHFIYREDAVRLRRNHGHEHASKPPRVLRPIKKL
jgi:uncharacterized protein (DUF39 family)